MRGYRKFRSDSYEGQLTDGEREQLYVRLSESKLALLDVARRSPVWRRGRFKGRRPSVETLSEISARIRLEVALGELKMTSTVEQGLREKMVKFYGPGNALEKMLDEIMTLIANEVKKRTIENLDPQARTAAAKLLLKRSDQKLNQAKFKWTKKVFRTVGKTKKNELEAAAPIRNRDAAIPGEVLDRVISELNLL